MIERTESPGEQTDVRDPLALDDDGVRVWKKRIDQAETVRKGFEGPWQDHLDAYEGKSLKIEPRQDTVIVPKDFANVNQKAAQLFFRTPDVQLTAELPGLEDAVTVFQAVLNKKLGPKGADVKRAVDKMIFDCLCPAGMGCCKIGYDVVTSGTVPMQVGEAPNPLAPPDPLTGQPVMQPVMRDAPNIVHEEWFVRRFSPMKLLIPAGFKDNAFDEAPWLAMRFTEPLFTAKSHYGLPEDFQVTTSRDTHVFYKDTKDPHVSEDLVEGIEVWYKAALYDEQEVHPLKIRRLVLIDGLDRAAVHEDSKYQRWTPTGQLEPVSLIGFPIEVLTLRDLSDSAYQPSDCAITRGLVNEESKFRTQMVRMRDANPPLRWVDIDRLGKDTVTKIENGDIGHLIPVSGDGSTQMGELAKSQYPRENYTAQDYIDRDISEAWAMGANQRGVQEQQARTATEVQTQQGNADVRLDAERNRVLDTHLRIVTKFASLLQLFADKTDYVQLEGEQGEQRLEAWDKTRIAGAFAFSAKPDSAIRVDAANDRRQMLEFVNYTAKSPNMNQRELMAALCRKHNLDPAKLLIEPPPPQPPQPNVSVRVTMEDLAGPVAPIAVKILQQAGYQISPEDLQLVQQNTHMIMQAQTRMDTAMAQATAPLPKNPPHGGPAQKVDLLSKRATENTGGLPGLAGGGVQ